MPGGNEGEKKQFSTVCTVSTVSRCYGFCDGLLLRSFLALSWLTLFVWNTNKWIAISKGKETLDNELLGGHTCQTK